MYIGDKRYAPYVGSTRRKVITEKALPYDAEVEYLESTGTQWIDTGIKVAFPINVKMKFEYISGTGSAVCLLGARYNATWSDKMVWWVNGNQKKFALNYGALDTGYLSNTTVSGVHTIETDGGYVYEDDVLVYSPSTTPASSDRNYNIYLFALCKSDNTPDLRVLKMKVHSIYIKNGNNVIFDAIPVRVGTTGYLYDKISGTLFGNAGTGDFTLGPDKT